jgi:hypothetical protein
MEKPRWYAHGGGVFRNEPFETELAAYEYFRLTDKEAKRQGHIYPKDLVIFPVFDPAITTEYLISLFRAKK